MDCGRGARLEARVERCEEGSSGVVAVVVVVVVVVMVSWSRFWMVLRMCPRERALCREVMAS